MVRQTISKIAFLLCIVSLASTACCPEKISRKGVGEESGNGFRQQVEPQKRKSSGFRYHVLLYNAKLEPFLDRVRRWLELREGHQFLFNFEWEEGVVPWQVIDFFHAQGVSFSELLQKFQEETGLRIEPRIDRRRCEMVIRVCKTTLQKKCFDTGRNNPLQFTAYVPKELIERLRTRRYQLGLVASWQKETPFFQALRGLTGDYDPFMIELLKITLLLTNIRIRFKEASSRDITYFEATNPTIIPDIPHSICKGEVVFMTGLLGFRFWSYPLGNYWVTFAHAVSWVDYATSVDRSNIKDLLKEWVNSYYCFPYESVTIMSYRKFRSLLRVKNALFEIDSSLRRE